MYIQKKRKIFIVKAFVYNVKENSNLAQYKIFHKAIVHTKQKKKLLMIFLFSILIFNALCENFKIYFDSAY